MSWLGDWINGLDLRDQTMLWTIVVAGTAPNRIFTLLSHQEVVTCPSGQRVVSTTVGRHDED